MALALALALVCLHACMLASRAGTSSFLPEFVHVSESGAHDRIQPKDKYKLIAISGASLLQLKDQARHRH